ncbi:hypothetical protein [Lysinibacillus xylanilyticus]|uniref:hypothetical protein n=1 Tax=Lysinibacillus xylanilyticus TaxID=582475 RepID=UPI003CFC5210
MCESVAAATKGVCLCESVATATKGVCLCESVATATKGVCLCESGAAATKGFYLRESVKATAAAAATTFWYAALFDRSFLINTQKKIKYTGEDNGTTT